MDYIIIPITIRVTGKDRCKTLAAISIFFRASFRLFVLVSFASTRTYVHVHTCAYVRPVNFTYQRPVRSRNVARPETRSFELGFSQLYTRHIVPRCPPTLLVAGLSSYFSCSPLCILRTRADPHNRQYRRRGGVYKLRA